MIILESINRKQNENKSRRGWTNIFDRKIGERVKILRWDKSFNLDQILRLDLGEAIQQSDEKNGVHWNEKGAFKGRHVRKLFQKHKHKSQSWPMNDSFSEQLLTELCTELY